MYCSEPNPKILDKMFKKIVDLSLEYMVLQCKKDKENIPTITPKPLEFDELVEKGYCAARDGQIHFEFAK